MDSPSRTIESLDDALGTIKSLLLTIQSHAISTALITECERATFKEAVGFLDEHVPALLRSHEALRGWFVKDLNPTIREFTSGEMVLDGCPGHLRGDLSHADNLIRILNGSKP
jgi:hypothetical protein